ncbi:hypothetical protein [Microbacterium gilvum]|uniref:Lipoprotein n=1 Tax=Microbacterium gilvum TaxID=1336204 RepID=A0ABP8ZPJ0_9MICO
MPRRRLAIAVVSATLAVALTACTPEPAATPTPTGFASEEEAFAAAEETYRAYVDASNEFNSGNDEATPEEHLIGEMLQTERETRDLLETNDQHFEGAFLVSQFIPEKYAQIAHSVTITAIVCMDSSDVIVVDADGEDVTPADDNPEYALHVTFTSVNGQLLISDSQQSDESC